MALFTCAFDVCGVFETLFKVQIPYLVYHHVVKKLTCVGSASRTVSCPELLRPARDSAILWRAMASISIPAPSSLAVRHP